MSKTLAIIGCGHLGLQIAHFAISGSHFDDVVFFDDFTKETTVSDFKILGTVAFVEQAYNENLFDELIVGIGYKHPEVKKELFERFEKSVPFATIIHKSCQVDPSVVIKAGSILYPNCCIDANVVIESNVIVNLSCTIAHDSVIAAHNFIAPGVTIAGFVTVGSLCMIGIGTVIIDNIKITNGTVTGGGSVVIKDIEQKGLYAGNPAKFIR
jgi:sugar O-acyltransferase (sialic acid O-acetyltransferase NeuD family)